MRKFQWMYVLYVLPFIPSRIISLFYEVDGISYFVGAGFVSMFAFVHLKILDMQGRLVKKK